MFGVHLAGGDQATLDKLAQELKATQQPDGGWASLDGRPSDAYSTGEALWVLHDVGGVSHLRCGLGAGNRLPAADPGAATVPGTWCRACIRPRR